MWRRLAVAPRWASSSVRLADSRGLSSVFFSSSSSSSSASAYSPPPKCLRDIQHSIANATSSLQVDLASELLRSNRLFCFNVKRSQVDLWKPKAKHSGVGDEDDVLSSSSSSSSSSAPSGRDVAVFQTLPMGDFAFASFDQRLESHEALPVVTKMTSAQESERGIPHSNGFFVNEFVVLQWLFQAFANLHDAPKVHALYLEMIRKLQQLPCASKDSKASELSVKDVLERLMPPIRTGQFLTSVHNTFEASSPTQTQTQTQTQQPSSDDQQEIQQVDPQITKINDAAYQFCVQNLQEMPVLALYFAGRGHFLPNVWKKGENVQLGFEILKKMVTEGQNLPFNYNTYKNALINNLFFHPKPAVGLQNAREIAKWMTEHAGFYVPNRAWGAIMTRLFDANAPIPELVEFLKQRPVYNQSHQLLYALSNLLASHQNTKVALVLLKEFMEMADQVSSASDQDALLTYLLKMVINAEPSIEEFEEYMRVMSHNGTKAGKGAGYSVVDFYLNPNHHPHEATNEQIAQKFEEFWGSVALIFAPMEFPAAEGAKIILQNSKLIDGYVWDIQMEPFVNALKPLEKADRVALTHYMLWRLIQKPKRVIQLRQAVPLLNNLDTFVDGKTLHHVVEYYLNRFNHVAKRNPSEIVDEFLVFAQQNNRVFNSLALLLQFALDFCLSRKWRVECDKLVEFGRANGIKPNAPTVKRLERFYRQGDRSALDAWLKCVKVGKH